MKFKSMLVAALAAMTIASCQKSENVPDQEAQAEGQEVYVSFDCTTNQTSTYATDVNAAPGESKAADVTVYIFNKADGIYEASAKYTPGNAPEAGLGDPTAGVPNKYRTESVLVKSGTKLVYGVANAQGTTANSIKYILDNLVPGTSTVSALDNITVVASRDANNGGNIVVGSDPAQGGGYLSTDKFLMTSYATTIVLPAPTNGNGNAAATPFIVGTANTTATTPNPNIKLNRIVSKMAVKGSPADVGTNPANNIINKSDGLVKGTDFKYIVEGTAKKAYAFQRVSGGIFADPTNTPYPYVSNQAAAVADFNWIYDITPATLASLLSAEFASPKPLTAVPYTFTTISNLQPTANKNSAYTLENINGDLDLHCTTNQALIEINYVPQMMNVSGAESTWAVDPAYATGLAANTSFFRAKRTVIQVTTTPSMTTSEEVAYFRSQADANTWLTMDYYSGTTHVYAVDTVGATSWTLSSTGNVEHQSGKKTEILEYVNGKSYYIALVQPTTLTLSPTNTFSALRNYIHILKIKTIPGIGLHLSEIGDEGNKPNSTNLYIAVDVEILPWTVSEQDVDL